MPPGPSVPDLVRSATERYIAGATSPAQQVEQIRAGLVRDGFFSHGTSGEPVSPAGHGLDRLVSMVGTGPMVGDQEQYAALMALMVRSIGIPARVVVGFAPSGTADAEVALRGSDLSAWVEVPFDGFGWVPFDPTPPPDKPLTDIQERAQTERREVAVEVPPALPQVPPDTVDNESADQRPEDAPPPDTADADSFMPALLVTMFGWTLLVLALFAAPIVAILLIKAGVADAGWPPDARPTGSPAAGRSWWTPRRTPVSGRPPGTPGPRWRGTWPAPACCSWTGWPRRPTRPSSHPRRSTTTGPVATGVRWTTAAPSCWVGSASGGGGAPACPWRRCVAGNVDARAGQTVQRATANFDRCRRTAARLAQRTEQ